MTTDFDANSSNTSLTNDPVILEYGDDVLNSPKQIPKRKDSQTESSLMQENCLETLLQLSNALEPYKETFSDELCENIHNMIGNIAKYVISVDLTKSEKNNLNTTNVTNRFISSDSDSDSDYDKSILEDEIIKLTKHNTLLLAEKDKLLIAYRALQTQHSKEINTLRVECAKYKKDYETEHRIAVDKERQVQSMLSQCYLLREDNARHVKTITQLEKNNSKKGCPSCSSIGGFPAIHSKPVEKQMASLTQELASLRGITDMLRYELHHSKTSQTKEKLDLNQTMHSLETQIRYLETLNSELMLQLDLELKNKKNIEQSRELYVEDLNESQKCIVDCNKDVMRASYDSMIQAQRLDQAIKDRDESIETAQSIRSQHTNRIRELYNHIKSLKQEIDSLSTLNLDKVNKTKSIDEFRKELSSLGQSLDFILQLESSILSLDIPSLHSSSSSIPTSMSPIRSSQSAIRSPESPQKSVYSITSNITSSPSKESQGFEKKKETLPFPYETPQSPDSLKNRSRYSPTNTSHDQGLKLSPSIHSSTMDDQSKTTRIIIPKVIENEIESYKVKIIELEHQLEDIQQEYMMETKSTAEQVNAMVTRVQILQSTNLQLQSELQQKTLEFEQTNNDLIKVNELIRIIQQERDVAFQEKSVIEAERGGLEKKVIEIQRQAEEANKSLMDEYISDWNNLEEHVEDVRAQRNEIQDKCDKFEIENKELREALKESAEYFTHTAQSFYKTQTTQYKTYEEVFTKMQIENRKLTLELQTLRENASNIQDISETLNIVLESKEMVMERTVDDTNDANDVNQIDEINVDGSIPSIQALRPMLYNILDTITIKEDQDKDKDSESRKKENESVNKRKVVLSEILMKRFLEYVTIAVDNSIDEINELKSQKSKLEQQNYSFQQIINDMEENRNLYRMQVISLKKQVGESSTESYRDKSIIKNLSKELMEQKSLIPIKPTTSNISTQTRVFSFTVGTDTSDLELLQTMEIEKMSNRLVEKYKKEIEDLQNSYEYQINQLQNQIDELTLESNVNKRLNENTQDNIQDNSAWKELELKLKQEQVRNETITKQIESIPASLIISQAEKRVLESKLKKMMESYELKLFHQQKQSDRKISELRSFYQLLEQEKDSYYNKVQQQALTIHQLSHTIHSLQFDSLTPTPSIPWENISKPASKFKDLENNPISSNQPKKALGEKEKEKVLEPRIHPIGTPGVKILSDTSFDVSNVRRDRSGGVEKGMETPIVHSGDRENNKVQGNKQKIHQELQTIARIPSFESSVLEGRPESTSTPTPIKTLQQSLKENEELFERFYGQLH